MCARQTDCQFVCNAFLVRKECREQNDIRSTASLNVGLYVILSHLNKLLLFNTDRYNVFGVNNLLVKVGSLRKGPGAIYSVIDLKSFFHCLPIAPESRRYCGVRGYMTPTYVWRVAALGISIVPSVVSDMLEKALSPEVKKSACFPSWMT